MGNLIYKMAIKKGMSYLKKDPEKNIPKLIHFVEKFLPGDQYDELIHKIKKGMKDEKNPLRNLLLSLWTDVDDGIRQKILENIVFNGGVDGSKKRKRYKEKWGYPIPKVMILRKDLSKSPEQDFKKIDALIQEGQKLGIYVYIFMHKPTKEGTDLVLKFAQKHDEAVFISLMKIDDIDGILSRQILTFKNVIPIISVDACSLNESVGSGIENYQSMKKNKILFGMVNQYQEENYQDIISDSYIQWMISKGAKFSFYVPKFDLKARKEVKEYEQKLSKRISLQSKKYPLLLLDFAKAQRIDQEKNKAGKYYIDIDGDGFVSMSFFESEKIGNIDNQDLLEILSRFK